MSMAVFWVLTLCGLVDGTNVSEEHRLLTVCLQEISVTMWTGFVWLTAGIGSGLNTVLNL
jgi:hypothetical protein